MRLVQCATLLYFAWCAGDGCQDCKCCTVLLQCRALLILFSVPWSPGAAKKKQMLSALLFVLFPNSSCCLPCDLVLVCFLLFGCLQVQMNMDQRYDLECRRHVLVHQAVGC